MFSSNTMNKRICGVLIAVAVAAVAVFGFSACNVQTKTEVDTTLNPKVSNGATIHSGILTVGINASNSPYGGTNSSNQTVGLDVDVAAAIAEELGLKLQIVDVSSSGRNALNNKQIDVALGLSKSGTSEKVSYTDSYISDGPSLYCLSSNKPESIEAVASQLAAGEAKVLVQADTTSAMKVTEAVGIDKVVAMPTIQEAFNALENGQQKYLVVDAVIGDYFARNYSDVIRYSFLGADCVTPIYAVTLSENAELTPRVNDAVRTITKNGVLRVITAKWLGSDGKTLMPGQVNLSTLPARAFGV